MNNEEKARQIKNRFGYLQSYRSYFDSGIWQEIADYVLPIREDLKGDRKPGQIRATKMYDGTAVSALNLFADGLHGYMISPSIQWFTLRLPRHLRFIENVPEVREWIEDIQSDIYSAFQSSNFYSEMRTYFKDGGGIGTASLYMEEDIATGKVIFICLHPKEGYIAEDKYGNADTFYRRVKLTARQAEQEFGKDNLSIPIQNALKNNSYQEFEFLHAVFPRDDFDSRKITATNKKYASIWSEFNSNHICRESGYDSFPYMVWRYSKSGDVYGFSPASFALPEIKSLNAISKDLLGAAQMAVRPPYNIPIEMKGKVRLTPFGMNYYGSDYNRKISPINTGINFPIALDREDKKREIIEKHFHVDFFLMLQRAERQMTATEIMERMGEKASVLSASVGDLTATLDSIIDHVFEIEMAAGRIPPPPDILMDYGGAKIDITYMGPLAQAQRRLFETQGIRTGLELAAPLFAIFPETVDLINADATLKELLISNGFPQSALNPPDVVMTTRQQKALQQQNEGMKLDQERMSEVLKKLAQASKNAGGSQGISELAAMLGEGA